MNMMTVILGVIVGLLVLTLLVVIHEFGHFLLARRNGVEVKEFGIGFPPRAIAWQKTSEGWVRLRKIEGEWVLAESKKVMAESKKVKRADGVNRDKLVEEGLIFSLNWLPIGGFCAMKGENASSRERGSFGRASFWAKTKILFGGVAFNWLAAIVMLTVLAWTGMPQFMPGQFNLVGDVRMEYAKVKIERVEPDSPAERAGLKVGDEIVRLGEKRLTGAMEVVEYTRVAERTEVVIELVREGEKMVKQVPLNPVGSDYRLGVTPMTEGQTIARYSYGAPVVGVITTLQLTGETFKGVGNLLWNLSSGVARQFNFDERTRQEGQKQIGAAGEGVSGPLGIVALIFPQSVQAGPTYMALLAVIISVSLACMNVLPIPALDGGRWLLIAIYKLRRKTLTKEIEEKIVGRAFMVLIGLILLITILDIVRIKG